MVYVNDVCKYAKDVLFVSEEVLLMCLNDLMCSQWLEFWEHQMQKTYEMLKQSNKYSKNSKHEKIWQPFWDRVSNGLKIGSKRIYLTQSFSLNRLSRILSSKYLK